jgi:hypothetical protein
MLMKEMKERYSNIECQTGSMIKSNTIGCNDGLILQIVASTIDPASIQFYLFVIQVLLYSFSKLSIRIIIITINY